MPGPSALIAGATGLVGQHLLKEMLEDEYFKSITVLTREKLQIEDPRVNQVVLANFDELDSIEDSFNVDHVFCCLGTNLRSPGAKEVFRKVNLDYPLRMAKIAKKTVNFKCFHAVTSVGASKNAVLYYNTVKGQLEMALKKQDLNALKIYRPSLLLGKRKKTSTKEEIMKILALVLSFLVIKKQQLGPSSIHASCVAKSMLFVAKLNEPGDEIFRPRDMLTINEKSQA
jgi:uncharacterized protein YbjT (DUF2867 family)